MDSMFSDLAVAFGMGSMPILNGENRKLQDQLVNRQIECERVKGKNQAKLYIPSARKLLKKNFSPQPFRLVSGRSVCASRKSNHLNNILSAHRYNPQLL